MSFESIFENLVEFGVGRDDGDRVCQLVVFDESGRPYVESVSLPTSEDSSSEDDDGGPVRNYMDLVPGNEGLALAVTGLSDEDSEKLRVKFKRRPDMAYCRNCRLLINPVGHEGRCSVGRDKAVVDGWVLTDPEIVQKAWMGDALHRLAVRAHLLAYGQSMKLEESFVSNATMRSVLLKPEFLKYKREAGLKPTSSEHAYGTVFEVFWATDFEFRDLYWKSLKGISKAEGHLTECTRILVKRELLGQNCYA